VLASVQELSHKLLDVRFLVHRIRLHTFCLAGWLQVQWQPRPNQKTWYETLFRWLHPANSNYGTWIEERRQALLAASVESPYFWFSMVATAALLILLLDYARLQFVQRRSMWTTAELMADAYNRDQHSRQVAREAIAKYNQHIEQCNRAIEAAESGDARRGWGGTELEDLRAEIRRRKDELEAVRQERNKLQDELLQRSLILTDLKERFEALAGKVGETGDSGAEAPNLFTADSDGDVARFVEHINRLQEELYAERQKNRRLNGSQKRC